MDKNQKRKEIFAKNLRKALELNGITQTDLARNLNFTEATVSRWLSAEMYPRMDKVEKMANYLEVSVSNLVEGFENPLEPNFDADTTSLINNYNYLSEIGKKDLLNYSHKLIEKETEIKEYTPVYSIEKVSAGIGYKYINNEKILYYTDRKDLPPYDFATKIIGDSMEPKYNDGEIVLASQGYDNVNGDVYVVDYNGESFIKRVYNDGDRFRLVSINRNYKPIIINLPIDDDVYFNIIGKVIDKFTPIEKN